MSREDGISPVNCKVVPKQASSIAKPRFTAPGPCSSSDNLNLPRIHTSHHHRTRRSVTSSWDTLFSAVVRAKRHVLAGFSILPALCSTRKPRRQRLTAHGNSLIPGSTAVHPSVDIEMTAIHSCQRSCCYAKPLRRGSIYVSFIGWSCSDLIGLSSSKRIAPSVRSSNEHLFCLMTGC